MRIHLNLTLRKAAGLPRALVARSQGTADWWAAESSPEQAHWVLFRPTKSRFFFLYMSYQHLKSG